MKIVVFYIHGKNRNSGGVYGKEKEVDAPQT